MCWALASEQRNTLLTDEFQCLHDSSQVTSFGRVMIAMIELHILFWGFWGRGGGRTRRRAKKDVVDCLERKHLHPTCKNGSQHFWQNLERFLSSSLNWSQNCYETRCWTKNSFAVRCENHAWIPNVHILSWSGRREAVNPRPPSLPWVFPAEAWLFTFSTAPAGNAATEPISSLPFPSGNHMA